MEKTEMMKRYEQGTGECATWTWHEREFLTDDYIAWLESQLIEFEGGRITHETYEKLVSIIEEGLKPLDQLAPRVIQRIELLKMQLEEAQTKAKAYDRLMSGGKKTLKEIANFLGNPVAVDREGRLLWFPRKPEIGLTTWIWYDKYLPKNIFDYTGDWKNSLTLPDGWEEK